MSSAYIGSRVTFSYHKKREMNESKSISQKLATLNIKIYENHSNGDKISDHTSIVVCNYFIDDVFR